MINLFISANENDWETDDTLFPADRCLTEYILPQYKQKYASLGDAEIETIKTFPCIFAY